MTVAWWALGDTEAELATAIAELRAAGLQVLLGQRMEGVGRTRYMQQVDLAMPTPDTAEAAP